jgi:hypothetical protein
MDVHLITVAGGCVDVLPHMLDHYRKEGVKSIFINAHARRRDDAILFEIEKIAERFDAKIATVSVGPWSEELNPLLYKVSRRGLHDNWFVLADQDELQVYPAGLHDALEFCARKGYDFIEGALVDRVASDGLLHAVQAGEAIWSQFPFGALVTGPLLGGVINKIVALKGHVKIGRGQHHAYTGKRCPISDLYVPVHHFKWIGGLVERLQSRIAEYQSLKEPLWVESARFLSYLERKGRIRLEDETFLAAPCDPNYPHWETIRKWRLAANFFHGHPLSSY